jgi:hypothetical protein
MNVKLQQFVLLGFSDIAAAGCRALLGVDLHYHTDAEKLNQQIPNRDSTSFLDLGFVSCKGETEFDNAFSPLQIINIPSKNVSLVILNCQPSSDISSQLINWIMNLLAKNHVESLHILTALPIAESATDVIYEMSMFQEKSKGYPDPPREMKTSDDIFNKLIQFIHVVKIPTSCFVVSGRKARQGIASREELASIQVLQTLAQELTGIKFNILTSRELVYSELEETHVNKEVKSMYL